jgi:hypothetical protein
MSTIDITDDAELERWIALPVTDIRTLEEWAADEGRPMISAGELLLPPTEGISMRDAIVSAIDNTPAVRRVAVRYEGLQRDPAQAEDTEHEDFNDPALLRTVDTNILGYVDGVNGMITKYEWGESKSA